MNKILVTGANGFLGYHIIKQLNKRGISACALVPDPDADSAQPLKTLEVQLIKGSVTDPDSLLPAFAGVNTIIHMEFKVGLSDDPASLNSMEKINVEGTRVLMAAAKQAGVSKVVINSSILAVGVNREPEPIDHTADWAIHHTEIPYALSRRVVEMESLALAGPDFSVLVVCPSFTLGPEDYVKAPATRVLDLVRKGKLSVSVPIGLGVVDVRDFADGVVRAAEQGRSGLRYILSAHNVTFTELLTLASEVAGVKPPRLTLPVFLVKFAIWVVRAWSRLRGKPAPVAATITQLLGSYVWFNTDLARSELGWSPRPLRESIEDSLRWMAEQEHTTQ